VIPEQLIMLLFHYFLYLTFFSSLSYESDSVTAQIKKKNT